jgi:hypothetical protein
MNVNAVPLVIINILDAMKNLRVSCGASLIGPALKRNIIHIFFMGLEGPCFHRLAKAIRSALRLVFYIAGHGSNPAQSIPR